MTNNKLFIRYLIILVTFGTFISEVYDPHDVFWASKKNVLNVIFAKFAWGWTSLPVLLLSLCSFFNFRSNKKPAIKTLIRWLIASSYWFFMTQSLLITHSILDIILIYTGECQKEIIQQDENIITNRSGSSMMGLNSNHIMTISLSHISTPKACKQNGGQWTGFDISGHCFLLIHSSLFLLNELALHHSSSPSRNSPATNSKSSPSSQKVVPNSFASLFSFSFNSVIHFIHILAMTLGMFLFILWSIMLFSTCLYFHSWPEKLLGTIIGLSFLGLMYEKIYKKHQLT